MQKPSVKIPKPFGQHGVAAKTKKYLGKNAVNI